MDGSEKSAQRSLEAFGGSKLNRKTTPSGLTMTFRCWRICWCSRTSFFGSTNDVAHRPMTLPPSTNCLRSAALMTRLRQGYGVVSWMETLIQKVPMSEWKTEDLIAADKKFVWHPFTNMRDWCAPEHESLVLVEGEGAILRDSRGREYIDGNSSIWTNIHGHNHPHINGAIRKQLDHVAHTSFLGFTNPPAI